MSIDEGIMETVLALNVLGVNTVMSCEGHLDRGVGAPWIDIEATDVDELRNQMSEAFHRAAAAQQDTQLSRKETGSLSAEAHKLRQEVKRRNVKEVTRALEVLEEFYHYRQVPYDRRLVVNSPLSGSGEGRIMSQGAVLQETAPEERKQQKLTEYQEEMQAFTAFLKEKYFSDS